MKICWDTLEGVHLTRNGTFKKGEHTYIYKESCIKCGESYLTEKSRQSKFCGPSCVNKGRVFSAEVREKMSVAQIGKTHSVETRKKISASHIGKTISIETRKKMSDSQIGKVCSIETKERMSVAQAGRTWSMSIEAKKKMSERMSKCVGILSHNYKGGVKVLGLTTYEAYKDTLGLYEEIRKQKGTEILEVKCAYCGRWFVPTRFAVSGRLDAINNLNRGEQRLYCSGNCKQACPTYNQKTYPKGFKHVTSREVDPYLRKMVLERDNWTCQICGKTSKEAQLHCHHMDPAMQNPMFQNDTDSCITLCKGCHKKVHKQIGCRYIDLRCKKDFSDTVRSKGVNLQI